MKKLACSLGRHEWTTRVAGGESYKVCAACGKTPPGSLPPGSEPGHHAVTRSGAEPGDEIDRDIGTGGGFVG